MKKIVISFSLLAAFIIAYATPAKAQYPIVGLVNQHEIIELYRDGQYDVIKAKLANQGFKITKSEPDYTLNGLSHSGTFTMQFEEDSPSAAMRQYDIKQISEWDFKTEKHDGFMINEISTELYSNFNQYQIPELYNSYLQTYQNSPVYKASSYCDREEKCFYARGDIGGAPNGFIDNINFYFTLATYPYETLSGNKSQYYNFKGSYRYVRRKEPIKLVIKKAATPIKRKK